MSAPIDAALLNRCVEGCAISHQLLLETVSGLSDSQCREPTLLPMWTRGHLISHLARNAERHIHLFECASRGEIGDQYPGGLEQRNADIEQGATRSAAELVADLRSQVWNLEGQWARATPQAWQGSARRPGGAIVSVSDLVFLRWREVAIHLVDLNVGCDHSSWSDLYVEMETRKQLDSLSVQGFEVPGAARTLEPSLQLAWLIGRATVEGLHESPGFQI